MRFTVEAGDVPRRSPLIRMSTGLETVPVAVHDEVTDAITPIQHDPTTGEVAFLIDGDLDAGETRTLRPADGLGTATFPTTAQVKLDRVVLEVDGQHFADYIMAGHRRPYFWPILGPSGASVVRGQGSADHPHHTGATISYGGHSEGGATNIWSDWDEPPYGPGGRMLHRGFRRVRTGAVYGEIIQDLIYLDANGDPFADETRTIRWWWSGPSARFLDITSSISNVCDSGHGPFLMMVRIPESMGVPATGKLTNSAHHSWPERVYRRSDQYRAAWVDASGPSGGPPPPAPTGPPEDLPDLRADADAYKRIGTGAWHGIAVFDHPDNHDHPNMIGKYSMVQQITQSHYPPTKAANGPFSFTTRLFVHEGDCSRAGVAQTAADYAHPCNARIEA